VLHVFCIGSGLIIQQVRRIFKFLLFTGGDFLKSEVRFTGKSGRLMLLVNSNKSGTCLFPENDVNFLDKMS
jgi:hypothetical protein